MRKVKQNKNSFISSAKEQMTEAFKLPKELINGDSVITIQGREELYIENYRGILECSNNCIIVSTKHFKLTIGGQKLCVSYYNNDEMKVTGVIESISMVE